MSRALPSVSAERQQQRLRAETQALGLQGLSGVAAQPQQHSVLGDQALQSWQRGRQAEQSGNAFLQFTDTEINLLPPSHNPKPLGCRFGKKISQICYLRKQLPTSTGPAFLKIQDVG